jgi:predicted acetyltransferase
MDVRALSKDCLLFQDFDVNGCVRWNACRTARYVAAVRADGLEETPRKPGWVPQTTLWWVDGTEYLGRVGIRHRLTPALRERGGHIGYDIRPTARRRGPGRRRTTT